MANGAPLFQPNVSNTSALAHGNFVSTTALAPANEPVALQPATAQSMVERLAQLTSDPNLNLENMQGLLTLQKEMMQIQAEQEFNSALARLQPELPVIPKKGRVKYKDVDFNFAKFEDIMKAIQPLLTNEGFSLSFSGAAGGMYSGTLSHVLGHSRTSLIPLPADQSGGKNSIQAIGSTVSYAKRYLVIMLLNILTLDEDDDAMTASTITPDQLVTIEQYLQDAEMSPQDTKKFLEIYGVKAVPDIQKRDFASAIVILKQKKQMVRGVDPINLVKKG